MPSTAEEPRTCPCKLLPKSLSSFTAAEYGDIHSLSKIKDAATRKDDAGYNPIHFTAQFNHVAATVLLLQLGCPVDGGGHCGATPLHRAAFSGATAAMKVLLEWNAPDNNDCETNVLETEVTSAISSKEKYCDLLARDTSFGDESTPLHKAAAGGRYLAVHMILEALNERDLVLAKRLNRTIHKSSPMRKTSCLQDGLRAKDKYGRTPLDVAHHFFQIQGTERDAVARWDAVAGGLADWGKCVRLLENTATTDESGTIGIESKNVNLYESKAKYSLSSWRKNSNKSRDIPRLPLHLRKGVMACLDCNAIPGDDSNVCLTANWQATFQKALGNSASLCILAHTSATAMAKVVTTASRPNIITSSVTINGKNVIREDTNKPKEVAITAHSICKRCRKPTIAFYQLPGVGTLVCKSCKRFAK